MKFTSTSKEKNLLTIKNLHLIYKLHLYQTPTLRDLFIQAIKTPMSFLTNSPESFYALNNVNLSLKKGDRLGVIGENGSGKTSLCRCIAGMVTPQSGRIEIKGQVRSIFNLTVGIIPELTGRENARLLAKLIYPDLSPQEFSDVLDESLIFSGLAEFLDAPFYTYSKGMQVRLGLSIISAKPYDLLILDEVFDGADELFKQKISTRVMNLMNQSGAVIFVSHSLEQIKETCNRVIVLNKGQISFDGVVEEGINYYLNELKNHSSLEESKHNDFNLSI